MDKEFELLKRVKADKGEEFSDVPTRLSQNELESDLRKVIVNFSFLYNGGKLSVDDEKEIIVTNIYILLDILVKMGVHPGFILATLCKYNYEKIKNKDSIAYNSRGKKYNGIFFPYDEIRKELKRMNNFNYTGYNTELHHCYDDIKYVNDKFKIPYYKEPTVLSNDRKQSIYFSIVNQRTHISNADDIIDECVYLVDLIYTSISILVEMGIKPEKLLLDKIENEGEKEIHK